MAIQAARAPVFTPFSIMQAAVWGAPEQSSAADVRAPNTVT
jgi:hypothetical protein